MLFEGENWTKTDGEWWKNRVKGGVCAFLALVFFAVCAVGFLGYFALPLCGIEGEKEYFLYSESSQAVRKERLTGFDLFFVRGQSVRVWFEDGAEQGTEQGAGQSARRGAGLADEWAEEQVERLKGEVLFCEEAGGAVCYYGFAPKLGRGIVVKGERVNFQIAVRGASAAIGTPVLLGSF